MAAQKLCENLCHIYDKFAQHLAVDAPVILHDDFVLYRNRRQFDFPPLGDVGRKNDKNKKASIQCVCIQCCASV
jgi:hypothetical protein